MIVFLIIGLLCIFILYSAVKVGDERRYLDTYEGELKIYTFFNSDKFDAKLDFSTFSETGRITLYVWSRRRNLGTENPHIEIFPHGVVRVLKETGEVYDWFEY